MKAPTDSTLGLERALEELRIANESLRHELFEAEGRIACLDGDLRTAYAQLDALLTEGRKLAAPVMEKVHDEDDKWPDPDDLTIDPYEARMRQRETE